MANQLEADVKGLFELPPKAMFDEWNRIIDTYKMISEEQKGKKEGLTRREILDILSRMGGHILREEVVKDNCELIIKFAEGVKEFDRGARYHQVVNSPAYKDAMALRCFKSLEMGTLMPETDPYFKVDPEHSVMVSLLHGINRRFYTQKQVNQCLKAQKKEENHEYIISRDLEKGQFKLDHTSFAKKLKGLETQRPKLNDFGYHMFIGRTRVAGKDCFVVIDHQNGIRSLDRLEDSVPILWEAVRKRRSVLLTQSPGKGYEPLSDEQMIKLYDSYFAHNPRAVEFRDPFIANVSCKLEDKAFWQGKLR